MSDFSKHREAGGQRPGQIVRAPLRPIPDSLSEADPEDRDAYIAYHEFTVEQNQHEGFLLNPENSWAEFARTWYSYPASQQERLHRMWSNGFAETLRRARQGKSLWR